MKRCDIGPAVVTTILIADDHDVVRSGLRALLSEQSNWQVVAEGHTNKKIASTLNLSVKTI